MLPSWAVESSHSQYFLDDVFPSNEAILEAMSEIEQPWGELHHRLYFLPKIDRSECDNFRVIVSEKFCSSMVPLRSCIHIAEGNMDNLPPTIPTNISHDLGKIEYTERLKEFGYVYAWSNHGMPRIFPRRVEFGIRAYLC